MIPNTQAIATTTKIDTLTLMKILNFGTSMEIKKVGRWNPESGRKYVKHLSGQGLVSIIL